MEFYSVESETAHWGGLTQDYDKAIGNLHRARLIRPDVEWHLVFYIQ